jgi:hypothetical protein
MFRFLDSFRAALLLGKGQKYLRKGRYKEALAKAQKAKKLRMGAQLEWLCHSIDGKSRYHLRDSKNALVSLRRAEEILAPMLAAEKSSEPIQNIMNDITGYIEKIEQQNES